MYGERPGRWAFVFAGTYYFGQGNRRSYVSPDGLLQNVQATSSTYRNPSTVTVTDTVFSPLSLSDQGAYSEVGQHEGVGCRNTNAERVRRRGNSERISRGSSVHLAVVLVKR